MARNGAYKNRIVGTDVVPAGQLLANPMNWRVHPRHQQQALDAVLQDVGWVDDVIVNQRTGHIIDGHLRVTLALRQGEDTPVPVKYVDLSEDEERLILATFDPISALAAVDEDVLAELLEQVHTEDEVIAGLLEQVADGAGIELAMDEPPEDPGAQIDRADELREKWGTESGQLWRIPSNSVPGGEHRIICGDCTDPAVVDRIGASLCDVIVFDPEWDNVPELPSDFRQALVFGDGATIGGVIVDVFRAHNMVPVWLFVWDCVSCWYTPNRPLRRIKACAWYGDIDRYNPDGWHYGDPGDVRRVWNTRGEYVYVPDPRGKHLSDLFSMPITSFHAGELHPHSKPVDWVTMLIANCTVGDVYDPFVGSGTTIVACERVGRLCRGVEIEPKYVAVALQRLADMGLQPELVE